MNAILYGNLSVEIVSDLGTRVDRVTLRHAAAGLLRPRRPEAPPGAPMLGRERETAEALQAIQAGRPIGFHAACGYGKTTLLQHIAARASERGAAPACLYLRADRDRVADLLQHLAARLYTCDRPVQLTPGQCAQLLGQVSAVIAVDDLSAGPEKIGYLLDVLRGCSVVIGSAQPVLGRRGSSQDLAGLPDDAALALVAGDLGRSLTSQEIPAARRLAAAVDGQPLHLRQAAALVREGGHSFEWLARKAEHDPGVLDRLTISALAGHQRRALAVLALAAGALLPADVVAAIGQVAYLGECLESLHRRGLAEQRDDRFGLPVCKASSYRQMLLKDLDLAASARELADWLAARDPSTAQSLSAADAALAIVEYAAEQGDWEAVARLARAAEAVLFLAGRWEAWHHTLSLGLDAAKAAADRAAEAFFAHQLGSLAFCQDQLDDALQLLQHALTLREQIGDRDGAELTRHNLRLLQPPAPPPRPRAPRRIVVALASALGALALLTGTAAIAGAMFARQSNLSHSTGPASPTAAHGTSSGSGPGGGSSSSSGPGSGSSSSSGPGSGSSSGSGPGSGSSSGSGPGGGSSSSQSSPRVPNVVGESPAAAARQLESAGLSLGNQAQQCSNQIGQGLLIATSPPANTPAQRGSPVNLIESSGPCPVIVPDLVGQTQGQATTALQGLGLTVNSTTTSECDVTSDGIVVSQSPSGGLSVQEDSTVTITVCDGIETE
jgi:tetratricopeptide (TPR) repeat protein